MFIMMLYFAMPNSGGNHVAHTINGLQAKLDSHHEHRKHQCTMEKLKTLCLSVKTYYIWKIKEFEDFRDSVKH
ncbi:hypothetical protein ZOSMA_167G00080 [Zostera marina]|uniref:Uncharacterized protein n=1 Tax=Zostera marina TaxID=29655 RepID=A0A0K9PTC0_ZOSMR|nr:hypothetical protein ZOSMA_167G00080 [Zostera marina]